MSCLSVSVSPHIRGVSYSFEAVPICHFDRMDKSCKSSIVNKIIKFPAAFTRGFGAIAACNDIDCGFSGF
jgi:hypothetical protein